MEEGDDGGNARTASTLRQIGRQAYDIKVSALKSLMGDLDRWVESWPYDAEQDGWNDVKSRRFNDIVHAADAKVVAAQQARQAAEVTCGENNRIGGAINRMKCVGDMVTVTRSGLYVLDGGLKTTISIIRGGAGAFSATPIIGGISKVADVVWDWFLAFPAMHIARLGKFMEPVSFMFAVVLPSLPMMIFMVVIVGWLLGVLQTILAIPLWALLHMTPEPTFVGSQRQGYLLLLSLFARPALAVIGLFAAILISDPLVTFVVNGFFAVRGAIEGGMSGGNVVVYYLTAVPQFLVWMIALSVLLVVVLYMCFALPQTLPGAVLQWIGAGVTDLGESGAMGRIQEGMNPDRIKPRDNGRKEKRQRAADERAQLRRDERLARMIKDVDGGNSGGSSGKAKIISGGQGVAQGNRSAR